MARALTIGNGTMLVGIDQCGQVRDLYFPFVGHTNHVSGGSGTYVHRIGVWVDEMLTSLSDPGWQFTWVHEDDAVQTHIEGVHERIGITLVIKDVVHNEHNIFIRDITVTNMRAVPRTIKVFFGQEFRISESRRGDTAYYDPRVESLIHYKGRKAFLIHARTDGAPFRDYSVGLFNSEGKTGTYTDAEDGVLAQNPIEHGSVDSVCSVTKNLDGGVSGQISYWIAVGASIREVHALHHTILEETVPRLMLSTNHYWSAWVRMCDEAFPGIEPKLRTLYDQSLLTMRAHTDNHGGILASSDSDMLNQGRDSYSYVWPRDAALAAYAFDRAGYDDVSERFFDFVTPLLEPGGYLMHKYRVDGALGSSWHPWVQRGVVELPIQEDETATTLFMIAEHFALTRDIEFIEAHYNTFIEPAADFLAGYIDHETGLPSASYDLWEEKFGCSTYTAASVYGALMGVADLSGFLGKRENADKYRARARAIKQAMLAYLFDVERGAFIKLVRREGRTLVRDTTLDMSSLIGPLRFRVCTPTDACMMSTHKAVAEHLKVPTVYGGYMRYEGDRYFKTSENAPPNAWCITTLWMAQYAITAAQSLEELAAAYDILLWTYDRATVSGILPEQIHPDTGAHLSASPLVWSNAEFVITVREYSAKYKALGGV